MAYPEDKDDTYEKRINRIIKEEKKNEYGKQFKEISGYDLSRSSSGQYWMLCPDDVSGISDGGGNEYWDNDSIERKLGMPYAEELLNWWKKSVCEKNYGKEPAKKLKLKMPEEFKKDEDDDDDDE